MCCCFVLKFQTTIPISSYCSLLSPPCSRSTLSRALPLLDSPTQWVRTFSSWTSRFLNCVSVLFLQQCSNLKFKNLPVYLASWATSCFCLSRSTVLSVFFNLSTCLPALLCGESQSKNWTFFTVSHNNTSRLMLCFLFSLQFQAFPLPLSLAHDPHHINFVSFLILLHLWF